VGQSFWRSRSRHSSPSLPILVPSTTRVQSVSRQPPLFRYHPDVKS
jgi:hypothetical protein